MRTLIVAAMLCLIAVPARAEFIISNHDLIERYFQGDEPIFINFADGIEDGCLPRPDEIHSAIKSGLRRAGLHPTDLSGNARWTLLITAAGAEMKASDGSGNNTCYAGIEARLVMRRTFRDLVKPDERIRLAVTGLEAGSVMYGGKSSTQRLTNKWVSGIVDEIAHEILEAIE